MLISTANVVVRGTLRMRPANDAFTHTIRFSGINENNYVGGETMEPLATDVGLWVQMGGTADWYGATKTAWTRAAGMLAAGATQITLATAPTGWKAGDTV